MLYLTLCGLVSDELVTRMRMHQRSVLMMCILLRNFRQAFDRIVKLLVQHVCIVYGLHSVQNALCWRAVRMSERAKCPSFRIS